MATYSYSVVPASIDRTLRDLAPDLTLAAQCLGELLHDGTFLGELGPADLSRISDAYGTLIRLLARYAS